MTSKSSKPAGTTTSTSTTTPNSTQAPYLSDVFSNAKDLYNTAGPSYYPDSTVSPQTTGEKNALQGMVDLGGAGSPITTAAGGYEKDLLSGNFLPTTQTTRLNDLSNVNVGGSTNPYSTNLKTYADTNAGGTTNPMFNELAGYAGTNSGGSTNPAYGALSNFMGSNIGLSNPSTGYLNSLAGTNVGTNNYGAGRLSSLSSNNVAETSPSYGVLNNLMQRNSAVGAPGTQVMTNISEGPNAGINNAGGQALTGLSNSNLGYAAPYGLISSLAQQNPVANGLGTNTLKSVSDVNQSLVNPFNTTLQDYANGSHVGVNNPYTQDVVDAIKANVLPGIQSQFIQGGSLASPEAARASSQGLAAALASPLFRDYEAQQTNQLGAGTTLAGQYMTGAGLQGKTAADLGNLGLGGYSAQGAQAQNLASNILSGGSIQSGAASTLGNLALGGTRLQGDTAQNLQSGYLTGNQQQATTANMGLTGLLTGNKQMIDAASALEQGAVAGAGVQEQAAGALGTQAIQGQSLEQQAANDLYTGYTTGAKNSADAANDLYSGFITGQNNAAGSEADLYKGYIAGDTNNITAANDAGTLYNTGVANQNTGLSYAPATQTMPYTDQTYEYLGGYLQQQANQTDLNDSISRYNYDQTLPYNKLDEYQGQVTGNYGGTTSLTSPYFTNSTNDTIGTGLGILGLGVGVNSLTSGTGLIGSLFQ